MNEAGERLELVHRFFSGTGPTYDLIVNLATFGIDKLWKRTIVNQIPPGATRVLDLACGTGILTFAIARRFPDGEVVGVELRDEYLNIARQKAARIGVKNIRWILSRAEDYRPDARFDCVVSSYLAKYADLDILTRNTREMLKDGGLVLMHDFTYPPKRYLVAIWRVYFKGLQRLGTPLFPSWKEIFYGLPRLIDETRWTTELTEALEKNGFQEVRLRYLTAYGSAIVTARK